MKQGLLKSSAPKRNILLKPASIHLAAFLLPVLALLATYAVVGIHPFGDWSILALDMKNQYISYLSYFRDEMVLGGQGWLYTFSKALGGDMAGLSAYYLLSPFNLILLLFPLSKLADGVLVMTLLKIGCCGLTMSLLLNRKKASIASLLFSVPYALMDFNNAFQQNTMWLDGVILLPLIVLGTERLLDGKSPLLYILALAAAIITCYYVGYILCLFSLLYFLVSFLFFHPVPAGAQGGAAAITAPYSHLKTLAGWRGAGRFVLASLLGGGLSAAVLLPAVLSLQGGKASFTLASLLEKSFVSLPDVVSRYMPGTVNMAMIFFGYPQIYCGMLALCCAVLLLFNQKVEKRRRVGAFILLAVIVVSFCVGPLDRIWHGLNKPVGFLYRYSFLFSFLLLAIGWQGFIRLRFNPVYKALPWVVAGYAAVMLLVRRDDYGFFTTGKLLFGIALIAATALLLRLHALRRGRRVVIALLLGLMLLDMGANLYLGLRRVEYFEYPYYQSFVTRYQPAIDKIRQEDDSFYRLEKAEFLNDNDAMMFGYRGLSHFSSSDKMAVRAFLDRMGLCDGGSSVKYADGSTVAVDKLLGVRYLLTEGPSAKPYELISEEYGISTWLNEDILPLGFMAGEVTAELPEVDVLTNQFEDHNALWRLIDPQLEDNLYRPAGTPEITLVNMTERDFYGERLFETPAPGEDAYVQFSLPVTSNDMLYVQFTTQNYKGVNLYVNGQLTEYGLITNNKHGIHALGRFEVGSTVEVRLVPQHNEFLIQDAWFYYEDGALLSEVVDRLSAGGWQLDEFTNSHLTGRVDNPGEEGWLLLTLPYEKGWQATLDDAPAETTLALGALTAVKVPEGRHTLTLRYTPPGLYAGLAVSLVCLAGIVVWMLLRRRAAGAAARP